MNSTTLQEAINKFRIVGLKPSSLVGQEKAFQECLAFLSGITKIGSQNRLRTSYGLKHVIEKSTDCYIYEGTFVLAALSSGFTMKRVGNGLTGTFNISERGISTRSAESASVRA